MATILGSIRRGFGGVTRFSGRDSRFQFWPYALLATGLAVVALAVGMGVTLGQMFASMQAYAAEHPEQATVVSSPGRYSIQIHGDAPELIPDLTPFLLANAIAVIALVLLLAAAVTRRLHDRGRRGHWGLIPLPFLFIGLALLPRVFAKGAGMESLVLVLFFNNVLYLAALVLLIVMLAKPGDRADNRFGPSPCSAC